MCRRKACPCTLNVARRVVQRIWNRFIVKGNVAHLSDGELSRYTTKTIKDTMFFRPGAVVFRTIFYKKIQKGNLYESIYLEKYESVA